MNKKTDCLWNVAACMALMALFTLMLPLNSRAQLSINAASTPYTIDFDNTVTGVNNGPFAGTGFTTTPAAGQLDTDAWAGAGMSDGSFAFGGMATMGDWARGSSAGGVTTGGIYAFEVATGNQTLGIQPGGSDFTPGTITLRIQNNLGATITDLAVSYDIWVRNDQGWANSFNFSHSPDNSTYTPEPALDFTSPAAPDPSPTWNSTARAITLNGLSIPNGAFFYLRWEGNDVSGSGSRDEFGLDAIVVEAVGTSSACSISGVSAGPVACVGPSNQFTVSFSVSNSSGPYQVVDATTSTVYGSGAGSPITATVPQSCGSVDIKVIDTGNPGCESASLPVTLQNCASSPVVITEVADPSDNANARFVEICNRGAAPVDISNYELNRYSNGSTTGSTVAVPGTVVLAPGDCFVFVSTGHPYTLSCSNVTSGSIDGNGNDTYELTDGACVIDIYGEVGVDGAGQPWEYTDQIALRDQMVVTGNQTWTSSEWSISGGSTANATPCTESACGAYYRTRQSGNWTDHNTWEVSTDGVSYAAAPAGCTPTFDNSVDVDIRSGHTVTLTSDLDIDNLEIQSGGHLIKENVLVNVQNGAGVDFNLLGTFTDNGTSSGGSVEFLGGATWQMGPGASFYKTGASSLINFRDNYEGGSMSAIPASANFIFQYFGGTGISLPTTDQMYYPNLTIESYNGLYNPSNGSFRFQGVTDFPTIKGNLDVGGAGSGQVVLYTQNTNPTPVTVLGNVTIRAGSTFTSNGSSFGTGLEVHGNLTISGTLELVGTSGSDGLLRFAGGNTQNVTGSGTATIRNLTVDKSGGQVNLGRDLTVDNLLTMNNRNLLTGNSTLTIAPGGNIAGGSASSYVQTNGSGYLKQQVSGLVVFPVGNGAYNPATVNNSGTTDNFSMRVFDDVLANGSAGPAFTANVVDRTWVLKEEVSGGSNVSLTLQWNSTQELGGFDRSICYVSQYDGGWGDDSDGVASNLGGGNYARSRTGIITLDDQETQFAVGSQGVLPIELTTFEARLRDGQVQLDWATATEINNDYFLVERSADALAFEAIGQVWGAGTTFEPQAYQWIDQTPLAGTNYYRLRQVDFDGAESFSPIRAVAQDLAVNHSVSLYPNPVQESCFLTFENPLESRLEIRLVSAFGQEVRRAMAEAGTLQYTLTLEGLPAGIYFLQLEYRTRPQTIRLIKN